MTGDISRPKPHIETRNVSHRVYFSRTAGEYATFVISAEGVEEHGEHAKRHSLELLELV